MMERLPFSRMPEKLFMGSGQARRNTGRFLGLSIAEWSLAWSRLSGGATRSGWGKPAPAVGTAGHLEGRESWNSPYPPLSEIHARRSTARIFGAVGIIAIGWIAAVIVRAGTRRLLGMLHVDRRIEESTGQKVGVESGIALGVFWVVILLTLVAVFNSLNLAIVSARSRPARHAAGRLRAAPGRRHWCSRWSAGWWPAWCGRCVNRALAEAHARRQAVGARRHGADEREPRRARCSGW